MKIISANNYDDLSRKAANILSAQVILNPDSVLGLATGSSPIGVYQKLIDWYNKGDIDFSMCKTVNLDEYVGLSENDENSYRYFMNTHFFDFININKKNTFVPNGSAENPEKQCVLYDNLINSLCGIDIQLLGIGHNGHIGFNEPDKAFEKTTHLVSLGETTRKANARFFGGDINKVPERAITMGIKSIMQAKKILLIANGVDKKDIVESALYGAVTPSVPASILQLHPDLTVVTAF